MDEYHANSALQETVKGYSIALGRKSAEHSPNGPVLIICDDPARTQQIAQQAEARQLRITKTENWAEAGAIIADHPSLIGSIAYIGDTGLAAAEHLSSVETASTARGQSLVINVESDHLDAAYSAFNPQYCHFVVGREPADLLATLAWSMLPQDPRVLNDDSEADFKDLRKISDDVQRIAQALMQLSGPAEAMSVAQSDSSAFVNRGNDQQLSDRVSPFKMQESDSLQAYSDDGEVLQQDPHSDVFKAQRHSRHPSRLPYNRYRRRYQPRMSAR